MNATPRRNCAVQFGSDIKTDILRVMRSRVFVTKASSESFGSGVKSGLTKMSKILSLQKWPKRCLVTQKFYHMEFMEKFLLEDIENSKKF